MKVVPSLIALMLFGCGEDDGSEGEAESEAESESESEAESECPVATGGPCGDLTCEEGSVCLIEVGCKGTVTRCAFLRPSCVNGCPSCECMSALCPSNCTELSDALRCPDC